MKENIEVTLWAIPCEYAESGYVVLPLLDDTHTPGAFPLKTHSFVMHYELPEDAAARQIEALEEAQERIEEAAAQKLHELDERIEKLRALPAPE